MPLYFTFLKKNSKSENQTGSCRPAMLLCEWWSEGLYLNNIYSIHSK